VKLVVLVTLPAALVTVIGPVVPPVGTLVVTVVPEASTVKVAATPLKSTEVVPRKLVPVRLTVSPTFPKLGLKLVTVGDRITVKLVVAVALPAGLVRVTCPVVAPVGTTAVMLVAETTVKVAGLPLKLTAVVVLRLVPVSVTTVPAGPEVGESLVTVGGKITVKLVVVVFEPTGFVTLMVPEGVPVATVAVIRLSELTV